MNKRIFLITVGIVAIAVLFLAPSCTRLTNYRPIITGLGAKPEKVIPLGSCQITCNATDPDGDALSYEWTATGGNISGTSAVVNWTAPQEVGTYNITVVVNDGHGGQDTRFVPLIVLSPPSIENLIVTPKGNIYLRKSTVAGCDYDVWMTEEYDIECIASGTGELFYEWSCDDGQISGAGSKITWTAPDKKSTDTVSVKVTVTVIVSDTTGNSIGENIVFYIPICTCGHWGAF
jgi:hypothetical protein